MKNFVVAVFEKIINMYLKDIPVLNIRLVKTRTSIKEGWGGKSIESFPPYQFFKTYIKGDKERATKSFEQWYYNRLIKDGQYAVAKADGGMRGGSLYRLIAELHRGEGIKLKSNFSNADEVLIHQGIKMRVLDRFALLNSIRSNGYYCCWDYIRVKKEGDSYTLIHGNHRVAALALSGYSSVMAATSRPLPLRIATRLVRVLLRKGRDYHSQANKKFFSSSSTDYNDSILE